MKRRAFISLIGGAAAAWPLAARAQDGQRDKQIRIGFLAAAVPTAAMLRAFRDALREHGYVEGQNLSIADRWPQGSSEQISDIAAEFVRSNVDIIVAWTTPASLPPKRRPPLFRSSWWESETRWARASSAVWRGQAGISPAL